MEQLTIPLPDAAERAAYVRRRLKLRSLVTTNLLYGGEGKSCRCLWCRRAFRLPRDARPALYCGPECKAAYLAACRQWNAPARSGRNLSANAFRQV